MGINSLGNLFQSLLVNPSDISNDFLENIEKMIKTPGILLPTLASLYNLITSILSSLYVISNCLIDCL